MPETGFWSYFRYEVGLWVLGSLWLAWGGLAALVRLAEEDAREELGDKIDAVSVTLLGYAHACPGQHHGHYFAILVLGLAVQANGQALLRQKPADLVDHDARSSRLTRGTSPAEKKLCPWAARARPKWRQVSS